MPSTTRCLRPTDVEPFVREHCFPPAEGGLVGIELEQLTVPRRRELGVVDHESLRAACKRLGTLPGGSTITFEPGGQLEVSSPPRPGSSAACAVAAADLAVVSRALADVDVRLVAVGLDPRGCGPRLLTAARYEAMEAYFDTQGSHGRTMMCATAALQVNVDVGELAAQARRWRLVHDLGPVLVATFANSPFAGGAPSGWRSGRAAVWAGIDPSRTRPAEASGDDPAADWARYALGANVMMVRTSEASFEALRSPLPFRRWIEEGHELGYPNLEDLAYHLGTLFPPVRARGWLELRMIDALPDPWWRAAVAVVCALLHDAEAAALAGRAAAPISDRWSDAARHGLAHPDLREASRACFVAALAALPRLGADATTLAAAEGFYERFVDRGRCPADDLLDRHRRQGGVLPRSPILEEAWT
ncbi:MAG: ergothioneine biosynthesis glutamate--cysteine ligase EgtA [Actinobacteria bacterium]|nr:ergothioneine biosynthesis glutamate--cysteine ligase EgtA [Actinomycetota bacterium]